jgi:MFS family permease
MERRERFFALTISGVHGVDHVLKRLFPPLVPVWAVAFGYPLWKLGLVVGALTFGSAIGQAPIGHLSDRFDRRYLLPAGIGLLGLGILGFALLPLVSGLSASVSIAGTRVSVRLALMLAAMFVAGLGSASVHPTGYPLITENVTPENKGKVLGMWGSASKFGDGLAPAFVGALLVVVAWYEIVSLFGLLALVYAVGLFVVLGGFETRPAGSTGERAAPHESSTEWRANRRQYLYPMAAVFAYFIVAIMAASGVTVFLPTFIERVYGYTITFAGTSLTPESTASFYYAGLLLLAGVVQLGTGELVDRYDARKVLLVYLAVAALALFSLSVATYGPVVTLVVLVVLGGSLWGMNPARDSLVSEITPPELEGRTFGYIWTGALLGSSVTPVVVGYVGDVAGLQTAFLVLAVAIVASAIPIGLLLSDRVYDDVSGTPTGAD